MDEKESDSDSVAADFEAKKHLEEVLDKSKSLMNFNINNLIENSLAGYYNNLAIEPFIKANQSLLNCSKNYLKESSIDTSSLTSKSSADFIFQFFEEKTEKLKDSIDCDDFSTVSIITPLYQQMVNIVSSEELLSLVGKDKNSLLQMLESISGNDEKLLDKEKEEGLYKSLVEQLPAINEEMLNKGIITINSKTFKCCFSMFEIVKFVFEIVKMFLLFEESFQEQIFFQFTKIFAGVINHSKENIIDGLGYEKGIFKSISQNVILMLISKLSFFYNLICLFYASVKKVIDNDIIHTQFSDLINKIEVTKDQAKGLLYKLTTKIIQEALSEVKEMNFLEYNVLNNDVSNYTKAVIFVLPKIYIACDFCLEVEEKNKLFMDFLSDYFEGLDSIMETKPLFEAEAKAKQFKKDMLNLKKSMVTFPGLETSWVKTKTDNYNKKLIPPTLLPKKKKEDN
eukprot:CAMPEP_0170539314 /NCGR_PEP_ID=MMETSP0209-20121228/103847_1 /TAXON_ID=665100 ORGANISM="Litonotus pictus, Strain P1" /NCGR_SAMPLE_ID=MMETSP0209 /ASSEMBLY_ACC=CAM_ASM_000301 /LENGTH=453 /DNA_ID=CAMNT_0010841201 /DNA_START=1986 /DNA_END=3347 /DNA_ORIENTATION=-